MSEERFTRTPDCLLEAFNIVKKFGDFTANDNVSLTIKPGGIHALLGENGAGKSTLVKIIYGSLQPTSGGLYWLERPVTIINPAAARRLGIGMVFQHFSLFDSLTVTENITLALPKNFHLNDVTGGVANISKKYGLSVNPSALVADLSVGERQRVEIVRCLLQEPKLLIMDEPTAVLTPHEADQLFLTLEHLANQGCAILYISHRLEEVRKLCHYATVLRQGKVVASVKPRDETPASLARLMVGYEIRTAKPASEKTSGDEMLTLKNLTIPSAGPFSMALKNIDLQVRRGEIVAIAGIAGNGQSELFEAISGERKILDKNSIKIDNKPCAKLGISARRKMGAAFVPEERLGHGAVPDFVLSDNVVLTRHASDKHLSKSVFLDRQQARVTAGRVNTSYDVRLSQQDPSASSLSGGNLQKFLVGRELDRAPKLVVINQPTWGVDAGAAALIRQVLLDLSMNDTAILVISQDLDEIFQVADRIAVICRGELSDTFPSRDISAEKVGILMTGAQKFEIGPLGAQ